MKDMEFAELIMLATACLERVFTRNLFSGPWVWDRYTKYVTQI